MSSTFGFEEAIQDTEKLLYGAETVHLVYEDSADKLQARTVEIASSKGLEVTGKGVAGIETIVDSNGFKLGWGPRPNLHLYFHEIGTYKDPPRTHVRPAVDELETEIQDDIQNKLTEGV
ncbi:hypothetical protein FEZ33_01200 [Ruoffia tabacinasalis]|uniref:Phage protein, HK97 gp10 family n=1 Tax=Ruoffia tabacinasalis TaxID=87458 RepID=A0A5R9EP75_9LACT|nr:hypothetical protein [Ruoffia tabacinasalis]TLQ49280.1 hypothetical protein FEZ33_01200 [Ruoffia tabacinasalis]